MWVEEREKRREGRREGRGEERGRGERGGREEEERGDGQRKRRGKESREVIQLTDYLLVSVSLTIFYVGHSDGALGNVGSQDHLHHGNKVGGAS